MQKPKPGLRTKATRARVGGRQARQDKAQRCLGSKLGRASEAYSGSRSDDHPWIERSGDLDSDQRNRNQHGEVAQRESLRLMAGTKPQQQNQWEAGEQFPHTQSR